MTKVATLGEVLAEIVARDRGDGFRRPLKLSGPFPSGAPAIFIDQVARLGQPCGIISCVGDDDFGWVNLERLTSDGVDVAAVDVLPDYPTGTAFVRYRENGDRDFVFNIKNSACGQIRLSRAGRDLLRECDHLHISGASLFSAELAQVTSEAVRVVKANGGSLSFDPNVRKEVVRDRKMLTSLRTILAECDTFLPSGDELTLLTDATTADEAVAEILSLGTTAIAVKHGASGATLYTRDGRIDCATYPVDDVDPTGAGDCFGATFVTCCLQGRSIEDSLDYACAAGARAVAVSGPMEGTSDFAQLNALRSEGRSSAGVCWWTLRSYARDASAPAPRTGMTSVCSAHPVVLEAAMLEAASLRAPVLIEATCNQVNHEGGYTGLTPADFRDLVYGIADRVAFPRSEITLGADHLGPNPWRHLRAEEAMKQAEAMVAAYVSAGFEKIHLDTSMGCRGEAILSGTLAAERAARLAVVAETMHPAEAAPLRYVVGTEVPTPGGATREIDHLEVTRPEAVLATLDEHRKAFAAAGVESASEAIIAVVAQPGVEFDDRKVVVYEPELASGLITVLEEMPGLVFEAHSTDYQPPGKLLQLVRDGFSILKVGPALTFAFRQALYGLDRVAAALDPGWSERSLIAEMEQIMVADPGHWQSHYRGAVDEVRWLRHFSYSDRIRYYWFHPAAQRAVAQLVEYLDGKTIPQSLLSEFLPGVQSRVVQGIVCPSPRELLRQAVRDVLRVYAAACRQEQICDADSERAALVA